MLLYACNRNMADRLDGMRGRSAGFPPAGLHRIWMAEVFFPSGILLGKTREVFQYNHSGQGSDRRRKNNRGGIGDSGRTSGSGR